MQRRLRSLAQAAGGSRIEAAHVSTLHQLGEAILAEAASRRQPELVGLKLLDEIGEEVVLLDCERTWRLR